jgi:hypothetical protein
VDRQESGGPTGSGSDGTIALLEPDDDREPSSGRRWSDGDASEHLEELIVGQLPTLLRSENAGPAVDVELVGPHLRIAGTMGIGHFRRLSDFLNHHEGLIELRDATVLRRNGDPTKVTTKSIWISPLEVTIIGQAVDPPRNGDAPDFYVPKVPRGLIVVTPGHTLTGEVYITAEAELSMFVESSDPAYIPMTDVRTRSLADRRVIARYGFALLNRRHIVALTELQAGMAPGRTVL